MNTEDFAWINEHSLELYEQYAGKWIAVYDGKIVGVGDTAPEVIAQAEQSAPGCNFVLEALDLEPDAIYGNL